MEKLRVCCLSLNSYVAKEIRELKIKLMLISLPSCWLNFNIGQLRIVLSTRQKFIRKKDFVEIYMCSECWFWVHKYLLAFGSTLLTFFEIEIILLINSKCSILGKSFTFDAYNARIRGLLSLSWSMKWLLYVWTSFGDQD